jgi:hypothetical protein
LPSRPASAATSPPRPPRSTRREGPACRRRTIAQGAATEVLLAASPLVDSVTGRYFEHCQEAVPFIPGVRRGVAGYALDPASARRLWDLSAELTGAGVTGAAAV